MGNNVNFPNGVNKALNYRNDNNCNLLSHMAHDPKSIFAPGNDEKVAGNKSENKGEELRAKKQATKEDWQLAKAMAKELANQASKSDATEETKKAATVAQRIADEKAEVAYKARKEYAAFMDKQESGKKADKKGELPLIDKDAESPFDEKRNLKVTAPKTNDLGTFKGPSVESVPKLNFPTDVNLGEKTMSSSKTIFENANFGEF